MPRSIVSLDTDRIKQYVFLTGTLKEIRGASALLDELNRKEMGETIRSKDPSAECIYANGGCGMFEVEAEKAEACIQAVEQLYRTKTLTGSITGTWMPVGDNDNFGDVFKALSYRLRAAKEGKDILFTPLTHPLLRPCDSCGEEYANKRMDDKLLCQSCANKRNKNTQIKQDIETFLNNKRQSEDYKLWDKLLSHLKKEPDYQTIDKERPEDFGKLGGLSKPSGYIGLLYADGDGMGQELERLQTKEKFSQFAKTVDDGIYEAVLAAVQTHLNPSNKWFPFDILLLGGDDLVMVTTAHKAIEVAITIGKTFRYYTEQRLGTPLNLSIGVAIAHSKFPFSNMLGLTEDLLKFAKKEAIKRTRESKDRKSQGLINFQVISASNSLNFSDDYKQVFVTKESGTGQKLIRTLRPYDIETMEQLLRVIREFKQLPRSKIQALQEAVFCDLGNSMLQCLALMNRLKDEQRKILHRTLSDFSEPNTSVIVPWLKRNNDYSTPFLDIAELFDFIH